MACAYQGESGAYSEQCAADIFAAAGRKVEFVGLGSFDEVFASLAEGKVEYAAVPVENTLGGSIHVNYDLLLRYHGQVHILGEHVHRVRHTLMALPGVRKEDIKKAMSHEQALAQTDNYLRNAGITPVKAYDTAGSAKLVREGDMRDTAAIASARAAEVHGLVVLDAGIEDDSNNFTRFLLLGGASPVLPEESVLKSSVVFVPHNNEAGALFKAHLRLRRARDRPEQDRVAALPAGLLRHRGGARRGGRDDEPLVLRLQEPQPGGAALGQAQPRRGRRRGGRRRGRGTCRTGARPSSSTPSTSTCWRGAPRSGASTRCATCAS